MAIQIQTSPAPILNVSGDGTTPFIVSYPAAFPSGSTIQISFTVVATDGFMRTCNLTANPTATGFTALVEGGPPGSTVTVTWSAVANYNVTISGPTPTQYSGTAAVARVRALTNYTSQPVDSTIYTYLQDALEQLQADLAITRKVQSDPVVPAQSTYQMPSDMQDLITLSYSTALPTIAGTIEYETLELEPASFISAAWNAPTISGGPIVCWRRITDQFNVLTIQLYPTAPSVGFLNTYYNSRPLLWDPSNPANVPDLDSQFLYTAILHACQMAAMGKENRGKAAYFGGEYDKWFAKCMVRVGRRSRPRRATVRNVTDAPNVIPNWTGLGSSY